jgi:hypothetical protein
MTEQKLDLLQFAASGATESGTASAQVVRCQLADPSLLRKLLDDVPGKFFCYAVAPSLASAAYTTEELSRLDARQPRSTL